MLDIKKNFPHLTRQPFLLMASSTPKKFTSHKHWRCQWQILNLGIFANSVLKKNLSARVGMNRAMLNSMIKSFSLFFSIFIASLAIKPNAITQVITFDYIGSTAGLWDYYTPKNYTLDTSMGGSIESEQYVFLEYLNSPFNSLPFSPGTVTFTIRGNFDLVGDALFGQGISIVDSAPPFRYNFSVIYGKSSTNPDTYGVLAYDGNNSYIYNLEPLGFEWSNQGGSSQITYTINLTPTPSGILVSGDLYDNSLLVYSFNDTFPNPFPTLSSYNFRPFMIAGGSNIVTATPVIQNITTLDWQVSIIPEPSTATVAVIIFSLIFLVARKRALNHKTLRGVAR